MKFPSIKSLANNAITTCKRFPFELLFALTGTVAAIIFINGDGSLPYSPYIKILMTANIGLLLSLAATLFTASTDVKNKWVIRFVAAVAGGCTMFMYNQQLRGSDGIRFFLLSLAFHLLVSFAAFTAKGKIQGFWQFNKTLFLRFLASLLYSAVLWAGLAAALSASNFLFNLHIASKVYGILFACIAGLFNTTFFLAGIPKNIEDLDTDNTYPKGLKVFTQYVLISLASVYLIILLAYEVKILIQWSLPKGLVSNLILGYAVFGILSILLIYPLRNQKENKWINTYARSFYFLLIPLLVLLFLAVFTRILPYGITVPRYFLIVLAGWLSFITFYFLFSRNQNIKIIPVSLSIVTLLAVYGPQSAFSISELSQRSKLIGLFKKYDGLKNGKLSSLSHKKVSRKDGLEAIQKLRYFVYDNEISDLQPCMEADISKAVDSIKKQKEYKSRHDNAGSGYATEWELQYGEMGWLTNYLGLNKFSESDTAVITNSYNFETINKSLLATNGVDYVLAFSNDIIGADSTQISSTGNIRIKQNADINEMFNIDINGEKLSFSARSIADSLINSESKFKTDEKTNGYGFKTFKLPNQMLAVTKQTKHFKVIFQINHLAFYGTDSATNITQVEGSYLISILK